MPGLPPPHRPHPRTTACSSGVTAASSARGFRGASSSTTASQPLPWPPSPPPAGPWPPLDPPSSPAGRSCGGWPGDRSGSTARNCSKPRGPRTRAGVGSPGRVAALVRRAEQACASNSRRGGDVHQAAVVADEQVRALAAQHRRSAGRPCRSGPHQRPRAEAMAQLLDHPPVAGTAQDQQASTGQGAAGTQQLLGGLGEALDRPDLAPPSSRPGRRPGSGRPARSCAGPAAGRPGPGPRA